MNKKLQGKRKSITQITQITKKITELCGRGGNDIMKGGRTRNKNGFSRNFFLGILTTYWLGIVKQKEQKERPRDIIIIIEKKKEWNRDLRIQKIWMFRNEQ